MDLLKLKKIYMIGIKGVGMTMLAEFLAAKGLEVSGSDIGEKFMTDAVLEKAGIKVFEGFSEENIPKDAELIIYSTAYNIKNNVEVAAVLIPPSPFLKGGKVKTYAEALGEVFNQNYGIAVCGSHGKTTTTAWLGYVLEKAGKNPSVMVGSRVPQFGGASIAGKSDILVIEADEYQNKLQYFNPKGVLLNNIDYDHPDYFKTREDYENVFIEFVKKIPKKGFLVTNFDDENIFKVARVNCKGRVVGYSVDYAGPANPPGPLYQGGDAQGGNLEADFIGYDIKQAGDRQFFKVKMKSEDGFDEIGDFTIKLAGMHNISNALAVIASAIEMEVGLMEIRKYLEEFTGTARRMEIMGKYRGAIIIDDYAHHPTEIKTTINGVRKIYNEQRLIVVFHPHTFTRTKALIDEFTQSFDEADELIVLDIYGSAREEQGGVHSRDIVAKIIRRGGQNSKIKTQYIPTLKECEEYLRANIGSRDVVLLMGAGDVFRIGENLVKN